MASTPWESLTPDQQRLIHQALVEPAFPHWHVPSTVMELAATIQTATAQQQAILPLGSGSKLHWGGLGKPVQQVVSTSALNQVIDHDASDLTVTVEAGVKLRDLQTLLQAERQFLPIDPAYPEQATLGGILATADTGSWRQRYGGIRDLILGISFVRWDGQVAKAGGRVVKNVAGYDLMKLFTGSYGTLGIVSQMTLRLYPWPETSQTLWLSGETSALAIAAQALLTSGLAPTAADLLSASLAQSLGLGELGGLLVRFQGIAISVQEQSQQLEAIAQQLALSQSSLDGSEEQELWQKLREQTTESQPESQVFCKIGVQPSQAVNFLTQCPGLGQIHLNTGLGRLVVGFTDRESSRHQLQQQRQLCEEAQGFLTVLAAPKELKQTFDLWGYRGNALPLMQTLKQQFDPLNCFSPGRFVGGI
jgi:glycolate oxidase FAD binding subunit